MSKIELSNLTKYGEPRHKGLLRKKTGVNNVTLTIRRGFTVLVGRAAAEERASEDDCGLESITMEPSIGDIDVTNIDRAIGELPWFSVSALYPT